MIFSFNPKLELLIHEVQVETRQTRELTGLAEISRGVLDAFRAMPREKFVPPEELDFAYENRPLPVGFGQTISQPFIVALMTELLRPQSQDIVLEVGAGSGYQAAILSCLVRRVVSVEIIDELAEAAARRLRRAGVNNVAVRCADGNLGWREEAPYDGIMVTACARQIPPALIAQLKPGGRMLIPVGERYGYQELRLIEKHPDATMSSRNILGVAFVPLVCPGSHRQSYSEPAE